MRTWLDERLNEARRDGIRHVAAPPINRLQPAVLEDGRLLARLEPHVTVVESAALAGVREPVCFVLYDARDKRRVALDLVPESLEERLASPEHVQAVLAGGDVDALVSFRGKDVVRNLFDCLCLFARLEHRLFTSEGFDHLLVEANPQARWFDLNRKGTTYVPVPWTDDAGEERFRSVRVTRKVRYRPRPARAA